MSKYRVTVWGDGDTPFVLDADVDYFGYIAPGAPEAVAELTGRVLLVNPDRIRAVAIGVRSDCAGE